MSMAHLAVHADCVLCHVGGGLAMIGYLALLCQSLVMCGQVRGRGHFEISRRQYQQLSVQEDGSEMLSQKGPGTQEGAIVELTVTAANGV